MSLKLDWTLALGGTLGPVLVRILGSTWRIRQHGVTCYYHRMLGTTARAVYSIWHRDILLLGYFARNEGIRVIISEHRDGELIARVVRRLGFETLRGSTTRGGMKVLRALDRMAEAGAAGDLAFTPDGPRGPARRVQKGVVYAASRTGFPVVPVGTAVDRFWAVNSWDRFRIPKPFSRCFVWIGPGIHVPAGADEEALERYRGIVEGAMHAAETEAVAALHRWCGR